MRAQFVGAEGDVVEGEGLDLAEVVLAVAVGTQVAVDALSGTTTTTTTPSSNGITPTSSPPTISVGG